MISLDDSIAEPALLAAFLCNHCPRSGMSRTRWPRCCRIILTRPLWASAPTTPMLTLATSRMSLPGRTAALAGPPRWLDLPLTANPCRRHKPGRPVRGWCRGSHPDWQPRHGDAHTAAVLYWNSPFGPVCWRRAERVFLSSPVASLRLERGERQDRVLTTADGTPRETGASPPGDDTPQPALLSALAQSL
jgi:hypothetical protein